MNIEQIFEKGIAEIISKDASYPAPAYYYVKDVINFTLNAVEKKTGKKRHVSGQELILFFKEYTIDKFGPMSVDVLKEWNIIQTIDFGQIIFNMINQQLLLNSPEDSIDDFKDGYDFHEVFTKPFEPLNHQNTVSIQII